MVITSIPVDSPPTGIEEWKNEPEKWKVLLKEQLCLDQGTVLWLSVVDWLMALRVAVEQELCQTGRVRRAAFWIFTCRRARSGSLLDENPRRNPRAERLVAWWGDKAPLKVVWGRSAHKLNSFCYLKSSFSSSFVHICLDYISVHGGIIYSKSWLMKRSAILAITSP